MTAAVSVDSMLDAVAAIAPIISCHAAESDRSRRLAQPVVDAMRSAGLYAISRPRALGGYELDPVTIFRVVEEVARHDAAAAWNLQISVASNWFLAWLPEETAVEISNNDPIIATSFTPGRRAMAVDGGYRLDGRWPFVSGCHDCEWLFFLPEILDGHEPRRDDRGVLQQRFMFLPVDQVTILDTWHTLGMRGTGSDDVVVSDVFIPERRTAPMVPLAAPGVAYRGPLYRLTVWVPIGLLAPPALGIARAAIDDLLGLARTKTPSFTASPLAQRQVVQQQVGEAEATLGAGRAYLHAAFGQAWDTAVRGGEITLQHKLKMQLATSHAVACAARAVDLVHAAAGASSIRDESSIQRYFRDVHTITQHAFASAGRYQSVGASMLGVESDWGFFAF